MFKIIGGDQKEYGPVSTEQMRQWILEGRANADTLVQNEGETEWKPLRAFSEFGDLLGEKPTKTSTEAPQVFREAGQRASAEAAASGTVEVGRCLSRSWELLQNQFGLVFGACAVVWGLNLVLSLVPVLGGLVSFIIHGALYGGLFLFFVRLIRGERVTVGDAFCGFRNSSGQLMLAGVVSLILTGIGWLFCLLPGVYLLVAWAFALILVVDRRMEFWPAMELSRREITRIWLPMFGLMVVAYLPVLLFSLYSNLRVFSVMMTHIDFSRGLDFARLGDVVRMGVSLGFWHQLILLLNLPFACGALMYAYEDLFGAQKPPPA